MESSSCGSSKEQSLRGGACVSTPRSSARTRHPAPAADFTLPGRDMAGVRPPREDEPARRVELDELAAGGVAGDHVAAVDASGTRVERARLPHPARCLVGIDEELPDRLRAFRDRDLALEGNLLSGAFHA